MALLWFLAISTLGIFIWRTIAKDIKESKRIRRKEEDGDID
jgi:hypothetical protein